MRRRLRKLTYWGYRWGRIGLPTLAVGGCVSDSVYRGFAVGQVQAVIVDVFAIAVDWWVRGFFPGTTS